MNVAGNADTLKRRYIYEVSIVLLAWSVAFSVVLTQPLIYYRVPRGRVLYDAAAVATLVVYVASVVVDLLKPVGRGIPSAVALSSALLALTYYLRLAYLVGREGASAVVLPLFNLMSFGSGASVLSLDLGQLGLLTLAYYSLRIARSRGFCGVSG